MPFTAQAKRGSQVVLVRWTGVVVGEYRADDSLLLPAWQAVG